MTDKYVNADIVAGKKGSPFQVGGTLLMTLCETEEVAAADADGDVYRFFRAVPADAKIVDLLVFNDAITAGTDYDIGFYESNSGAVVDKDALLDGGDLSSAHAAGSGLSGISAVDVANLVKPIYELAGHTAATKKPSYDICVTANTVGSAAGTITLQLTLAR